MPIKVLPPTTLPDRGLTEELFNVWVSELELYLDQDDRFIHFMNGGMYCEWESQETHEHRIRQKHRNDNTDELLLASRR